MNYEIIIQLAQNHFSGCLEVSHQSIYWWIYFYQGKLLYATNSIVPFERLERYLKCLSHQNSQINGTIWNQVRSNFENTQEKNFLKPSDYEAIYWLWQQEYLTQEDAILLVRQIMEEVLETYLLLPNFNRDILPNHLWEQVALLVPHDVTSFIQRVYHNLQNWQTLSPYISSPYQRPYFLSQYNPKNNQISLEKQQQLSQYLKGFSFRQLAAVLNQDAFKIAQGLKPLISSGVVILREPHTPFSQLPVLTTSFIQPLKQSIEQPNKISSHPQPKESKSRTIVCIDDSPIMLKQINQFLENHNFSVFVINDSVKALMEVIRIKPNLILMDVSMPNLDGHQLCRLLRNHSLFKTTPIIMVTGNKGLIDRAKAKVTGATDYLTKPFDQADLLKIVLRYLT